VTHKNKSETDHKFVLSININICFFSKSSANLSYSVSAVAVFIFPEDERKPCSVSFFCKMIQVLSESIKRERRSGHEAYITIRK